MKKCIIAIVSVFAILATTASLADFKIGVVDMQKIFKTSPQVKKLNTDLQSQFADRKNEILKMNAGLEKDMQSFTKNKAVMSPKDLSALKAKLAKEEADLRTSQGKFQQDLYAAQNKAMAAFMTKVQTSVANVAKKSNLDLVMPKNAALFYKPSADITSTVMNQLD